MVPGQGWGKSESNADGDARVDWFRHRPNTGRTWTAALKLKGSFLQQIRQHHLNPGMIG
ncbi:hypothetical protein DVU_3311 [Nitratidesulfovibrio vulgaris str. Hildenborough]|uniref:Uncharacterized protein n=1 Tax=Nitratidesulfovibrio vulgaris (strain ATCC 29579 / DSM 644 / CCUG 34227 / NCIMB 8303 / VKM B-1760 / Hildenborough) TaxID=882 RepID=Q725W4_NITV2|nr:hypothetical protein DVU_3311 [Nitratidesulfovibrio vulgaris str. Hildenborough]